MRGACACSCLHVLDVAAIVRQRKHMPNILIQIRLTPEQLARVDAWAGLLREQVRVPVSRASAIRNLLETHPALSKDNAQEGAC